MIRTAIYMRVSTDRQAREGDSIPAQREVLRKYIDQHEDMIFAGEYLDDGVTGTKDTRPELQRLLADVRNGSIDLIIVTKMDRLHRSLRNFLNMQDLLDKHHCNWLAVSEPMYDTSTPQGRMIINTMMNLAQFEAEQTGQRIRQVQSYKVSNGEVISGSTPPGLSIIGKRIVPNQDAPVVKEMFEYYSICGNMRRTIRAFDHYGIFPKTKSAYKNLLTNTKYIGVFRDNENFCEPIIGRELFYDVQRKLKMNIKVSQKETYIFSGLLRCAECGRAMGAGTRRRKNGKAIHQHRYRCVGHYSSISRCDNAKILDESVLERYLLSQLRPEMQNYIFEVSEAPAKTNTDRISALEKRLSRLKELFVNEFITIDEYKNDREMILNELSELKKQAQAKPVDLSAVKELLAKPFEEIYGTFNEEERRYFWRSILNGIRFDKRRNIQIIFLS